jgi:hypothetical protein
MIFSDLASPAEAGFAKAGNRSPLFGIMPSALGLQKERPVVIPGPAAGRSPE